MASKPPHRRTQAERTAATRLALLEATIDALSEVGYANVTTADIARRASVTRGAVAHHFASKVELVTESVRHLASQLVDRYLPPMRESRGAADSIESLIDQLWALHRSAAFAATIELWLAARTDTELRAALQGLEQDMQEAVALRAESIPGLPIAGTAVLLSTTLGTMRGLALLTFVHDDTSREWRWARRHLLELWASHHDAA